MHRAFEVHKLNDRGMRKAVRLAQTFDTQLALVHEILGVQELGLTSVYIDRCEEHLELASFYAKKELASQPGIQDHGAEFGRPGSHITVGDQPANEATASERPVPPLELYTTAALELELQRRHKNRNPTSKG